MRDRATLRGGGTRAGDWIHGGRRGESRGRKGERERERKPGVEKWGDRVREKRRMVSLAGGLKRAGGCERSQRREREGGAEGDNGGRVGELKRDGAVMEGSKSKRARERRSQTVRQAARQARKAGRQASRQPVHQPRPLDPLGLPT